MTQNGHPLSIKLEQILPILAKEIYGTPLAFLRENVQNAFDAIRQQIYREKVLGITGSHRIDIEIKGNVVKITDTGIGMTATDMKEFYWSIGKTGKNTDEAKEAGVVGTFGIGGMANFGVASELQLVSRTHINRPGVISSARRETLSISENCIFYDTDSKLGSRGTSIIAMVVDPFNSTVAEDYLKPIVRFVSVPVFLNAKRINGDSPPWTEPQRHHKDHPFSRPFNGTHGNITAEFLISADTQGRPTVTIANVLIDKHQVACEGILRVMGEALSTYRYGFRLADTGVSSIYSLGGHINCSLLKPTAGRDTLESESKIFLQKIVEIAELGITFLISEHMELSDTNTSFYRYVFQHNKFEMLNLATVRVYGLEQRIQLENISKFSKNGEVYFSKNADKRIMEVMSKQGKQIVLLSNDYYRNKCEESYLKRYCNAKVLDADVTAIKEFQLTEISGEEAAFIHGIEAILRTRYLVGNIRVVPAELTNRAIIWVPKNNKTGLLTLWLDIKHPYAIKIVSMRGNLGYGQLIDLFVRDYVFPMIKDAVPSISSEGFDVLLQRLQSDREIMVISPEDIRVMKELASNQPETTEQTEVPKRKSGGKSFNFSSQVSIRKTDVVDGGTIEKRAEEQGLEVTDETDIVQTDTPPRVQSIKQAIAQLDIPEKVLDFTNQQELSPWISGLYISLTLDAYSFYKDIIQRLPAIRFVWGGYRASYLFFESEQGVLYYDFEFSSLLRARDSTSETGTISITREPLFAKNNIFLPIPEEFTDLFLPRDNPVRIIVRHEIMTPETQSTLVE